MVKSSNLGYPRIGEKREWKIVAFPPLPDAGVFDDIKQWAADNIVVEA